MTLDAGSLGASLDSLRYWLSVFTGMVVVGLVIEYLPTFIKFINKEKFKTEMIGGLLITVGVAGELGVEIRTSRVEGRLRAAEQTEIAQQQERAARAEERSKTLELEVAQQLERAATAEKELLEVQDAIKDRTVSPAQRIHMLDVLRRLQSKCRVRFTIPSDDSEARRFSETLGPILEEAGWTVDKATVALGNLPGEVGLMITHYENVFPPTPCALTLRDALIGAGFKTGIGFGRRSTISRTMDQMVYR